MFSFHEILVTPRYLLGIGNSRVMQKDKGQARAQWVSNWLHFRITRDTCKKKKKNGYAIPTPEIDVIVFLKLPLSIVLYSLCQPSDNFMGCRWPKHHRLHSLITKHSQDIAPHWHPFGLAGQKQHLKFVLFNLRV